MQILSKDLVPMPTEFDPLHFAITPCNARKGNKVGL